jgi:hypothetical protein
MTGLLTLFSLNPDVDLDYLERRIREESFGDYGIAAKLATRRELLGQPELPRNNRTRRTESKKALLKAIEDAGGKW